MCHFKVFRILVLKLLAFLHQRVLKLSSTKLEGISTQMVHIRGLHGPPQGSQVGRAHSLNSASLRAVLLL